MCRHHWATLSDSLASLQREKQGCGRSRQHPVKKTCCHTLTRRELVCYWILHQTTIRRQFLSMSMQWRPNKITEILHIHWVNNTVLVIIMNMFVRYINPIKSPIFWLVADEALQCQNVLYTFNFWLLAMWFHIGQPRAMYKITSVHYPQVVYIHSV